MISKLNKVNIDGINLPSLEQLCKIVRLTDEELSILERRIQKEKTYFSAYLKVSTRSLSR